MSTIAYFFPSPVDRSTRSVGQLIRDAHVRIGVIDSARPLTAGEMDDGLNTLNDLLEQWSMESLNMFRVGDILFASISGQRDYKIGPGEYIDAERPHEVLSAQIEDEKKTPVIVSSAIYAGDLYGYVMSYDPAFPSANIRLGWTPGGETIALKVNQELSRYENIHEVHGLPAGYARPLIYALAVDLCPSFNITPSATLMRSAGTAKASLRKTLSALRIKQADTGLTHINGGSSFDIVRGY